MKIARFEKEGSVQHGVVEGDVVYALAGDLYGAFRRGERVGQLGEVRLLAPVEPSKILVVGLNYPGRGPEGEERRLPEEPMLALKAPTAVIGHGDNIVYPTMSRRVYHEAELAVIIGRRAKGVAEADAPNYILGFTCANDVSAFDLSRKDIQWGRSKSFDTFCPLGPVIATDLDPRDLTIRCRVNGETRQDTPTRHMVFGVHRLVSFASQVMTLLPGDVILTGTPPGLSEIHPGDVIEVAVEGIGVLVNRVIAAEG